jgi:hypothetical protein
MRAPSPRPSISEVACAIAEALDYSKSNIPTIEQSLRSLDRFRHFPNITTIKKDVAGLREHARELRDKYKDIPALAGSFDAVVRIFDPEKISGPDPRFDFVGRICAEMAKGAIRASPDKRLGERLRLIASYFYWYVTGERDCDLERACRAVTPKRTSRAPKGP